MLVKKSLTKVSLTQIFNLPRISSNYMHSEQLVTQKLKSTDLFKGSYQIDGSTIPLPTNRDLSTWRTFFERLDSVGIDLLQLPATPPQYEAAYLSTSLFATKKILDLEFNGIQMFSGEQRFLIGMQGTFIHGHNQIDGWRESRKILSPPVSPKNIHHNFDIFNDSISTAARKLIDDVSHKRYPTSKLFRYFTARIIPEIYLGLKVSDLEAKTIVNGAQSYYQTGPLIVLGFDKLPILKDFLYDRLNPYLQTLYHLLLQSQSQNSQGVLTQMLGSIDETERFPIFLAAFAGQGLLATSLEWITYSLTKNKDFQQKLRDSIGSPDHPELVKQFLETTTQTYPTATFILRETTRQLTQTQLGLPSKAVIALPLFSRLDPEIQKSAYELQFSIGLRKCLGRHTTEAIHRLYIKYLLENTNSLSCLNNPTPILSMTTFRPNQEFQFAFS